MEVRHGLYEKVMKAELQPASSSWIYQMGSEEERRGVKRSQYWTTFIDTKTTGKSMSTG
jgi:hypothetical protein